MCSVCLSYYLLGKIREDGDGRHGADTRGLVALRNDKMGLDGCHDCRSQRGMCGGMLDGGALRKALHN